MELKKDNPYRSKTYREFVARHGCCTEDLYCEGQVVAHHEPDGTAGRGIKASDVRVIPLCAKHHAEIHQFGKKTFYDQYNIDHKDIIISLVCEYFALVSEEENEYK